MLLDINFEKQILDGLSLQTIIRVTIILIITLFLRKYLAAFVTKIIFIGIRKFADKEHASKFKELLQKPIQSLLLCILFFIAFNQMNGFFEKIVLFERHKSTLINTKAIEAVTRISLMEIVDHLFIFAFIFYGILLCARSISFAFYIWVNKAKTIADKEKQQLLPLLRDVIVVLLWGFGFFTILGLVFHVNVAALIAGLGFGGVAIAFAAKESLENLLASFMIMVDKPLTIGDHIKIGSVEGNVEKIGFRSTRIRTFDKSLISMPNKSLIGTNLENFSERGLARVKFNVSASYGLTVQQITDLVQALKKVIDKDNHTSGECIVFVEHFAATIEISVAYYIVLPMQLPLDRIKESINLKIYQIMYQYGNGFGLPASISINTKLEDNEPSI